MKSRNPHDVLLAFVARHQTGAAAAKALGISHPHLVDLMKGRRGWSDPVLDKLGLTWVVVEKKAS